MTSITTYFYVTCTNSNATTLGNFAALTSVTGPIQLLCNNCPNLTTIGNFPVLTSGSWNFLTVICTNCPLLTSMATFPVLTSTGPGFLVECQTCPKVTNVGYFPQLQSAPTVPSWGHLGPSLC